ncbi:hypothetical protein [Serratia marcescens]|uniref:hypothetical protein n=1 Tax=Serratia TaxID=613 RepID=UPI0014615ED0|nr:hypothetical protein [Serratia marcescens]MBH2705899.1 hypothetical protein [Serratia marcescens]MBH2705911.1 hypothetical protein [Serratia marcescens]MBH3187429.1 hypothetical protein [Serratia marcescens]NMQ35729.1 hypothetical protein [Serratia marcescens]
MQVKSYKDYDAAYEIDAGYKYIEKDSEVQRSKTENVLSAVATILGAESLFAEGFNRGSSVRKMKIRIKNDALIAISPISLQVIDSSAGHFYTNACRIISRNEYFDINLDINGPGNGELIFKFLASSTDPNIIEGVSGFTDQNVCSIELRVFYGENYKHNRLHLIKINGTQYEPIYEQDWGADMGVMTFFSCLGEDKTPEPSFGLSFFEGRPVQKDQQGCFCIQFTPCGKRASYSEGNLSIDDDSEIYGVNAAKKFLYDYRKINTVKYERNALGVINGMVAIASSGHGLYSSIRKSSGQDFSLTCNITNLSRYNLFVVRTWNCTSSIMENTPILGGSSVTLIIGSGMKTTEAAVCMRMVLDESYLDITIDIEDFGSKKFLKVSKVKYTGKFGEEIITDHGKDVDYKLLHSSYYRNDTVSPVVVNLQTSGVTIGHLGELDISLLAFDKNKEGMALLNKSNF